MAEAEDNTLELDAPIDEDLDVPGLADETEGDEEELVISFDGETNEPPEEENSEGWKKVRAELREARQREAEKDARLAALEAPAVKLGPKPTLESCDYDADAFETALDAWKERERTAKETVTAQQRDAQAFEAEVQQNVEKMREQAVALKAPDFADARDEVLTRLDQAQLTVLTLAAKNGAQVMYALGKHPQRLAQLAAIKNPIKLAVAIADLEKGLTMTSRRRSPEPETIIRGSAPLSKPGPDKELERLEAKADKTGDRTEVMRYKRDQKAKLAAKGR